MYPRAGIAETRCLLLFPGRDNIATRTDEWYN